MSFVPEGFAVPEELVRDQLLLEPLGPEHNEADYRADRVRHADDFKAGRGFTYTVLDPPSRDVIGCVYIYPGRTPGFDASVRSWVTAERAELDGALHALVRDWLATAWPFSNPEYAPR